MLEIHCDHVKNRKWFVVRNKQYMKMLARTYEIAHPIAGVFLQLL